MRIHAIDLEAKRASDKTELFCDVQVPLQRLASSPDRGTAIRCGKLLELVRALSSDGSTREARAQVIRPKLLLTRGDIYEHFHPIVDQRTNPGAFREELRRYHEEHVVTVEIEADWHDYGPVHDGIPAMHYRIRVKGPRAKLGDEVRVNNPDEVRRVIYEAFGWET